MAERAWIRDFNISAAVLEPRGDVAVSTYQITPSLNTNSYLATNPCYTPAEGKSILVVGIVYKYCYSQLAVTLYRLTERPGKM